MDGSSQDELEQSADEKPSVEGQPLDSSRRPGEYVVVARRYRPQSFAELVGQNSIGRALSNAILSNRVGHAYLFTGARGVGKTSSARILAKALNCVEGPTPTPCNQCDICRRVSVGEDVDVLEIDGASNRGIDEIRELRQNVNVRPSRARFKIYIIDEVHMLTTPAFNALLKTLEEPPEHVKFIFCTTEAEKIPITILSRCQRFDFAGISVPEIAERLRQIAENEQVAAEPEALELLARRAAGSMRDSQSLLEQLLSFGGERITAADVHAMLGTAGDKRLGQILEHLVARQPGLALRELDEALGEGVDVGQLLAQLLGILRDCLVASVGAAPETFLHVSPSGRATVQTVAQQFGTNTILAAMQVLDHTLGRMRYSTHGRTLAELALVRIAGLEDLEQIATLIGQLDEQTSGEARAPVVRSAPPAGSEPAKKKPESLATPPPPIASAGASVAAASLPTAAMNPAAAPATLDSPANGTEFAPQRPTPENEPVGPSGAAREPEQNGEGEPWEIWKRALDRVEDTTADYARRAEKAELSPSTDLAATSGPKQLVVSFPTKYTSCKSFCERPDRIEKLVQALSDTAGGDWGVRFEVLPPPDDAVAETGTGRIAPRRDVIAEKSQHPLVQKAAELFRARVARVEEANG